MIFMLRFAKETYKFIVQLKYYDFFLTFLGRKLFLARGMGGEGRRGGTLFSDRGGLARSVAMDVLPPPVLGRGSSVLFSTVRWRDSVSASQLVSNVSFILQVML